FDDGSAAVTCERGRGVACLMGLDLGRLAQLGMDGRAEPINRRFVNGYEPSLDVLFRWVRDFYVEHEPMPWLLSRVPGDRAVAIVLTHDVDYGPAVDNARAFAEALAARGVGGSFFIQTKYRRDYNDRAFFDPAAVGTLAALRARGMELASHSVAHSRVFDTFPAGRGDERYPQYRPSVRNREVTVDGTVLGELRVSKFLLDTLADADVASFRPGYLANPFALPQLMHAAGYRFSSSLTANRTLTHLP
ncbi:MAG TPA: polysaccharide deacetylase family protein, partial [Lysobacter sp.]